MTYYGKLKRQAKNNLKGIIVCAYCGKKGTVEKGPDGKSWHMDHILPFSVYEIESLDNYVKSCQFCNISKGSKVLYPSENAITGSLAKFELTKLPTRSTSAPSAEQAHELKMAKQKINHLELIISHQKEIIESYKRHTEYYKQTIQAKDESHKLLLSVI